MCILILEILFLVLGLWLLFTGKVPDRFFRPLFGKGDYFLPPRQARLFGLLLVSPIPLVFGLTYVLAALSRQNPLGVMSVFEIAYTLVVAVIAIVVARRSRQKPAAADADKGSTV